jgi:hypothetical protein
VVNPTGIAIPQGLDQGQPPAPARTALWRWASRRVRRTTGEGVVLEHLHARMGLGIISEGLLRGSTRDLQLETSTSFRERPELAATWVQPLGTVARAVVAGRLEWAGLMAAASFARPDGEARPLPPQEQPSTGVAPLWLRKVFFKKMNQNTLGFLPNQMLPKYFRFEIKKTPLLRYR